MFPIQRKNDQFYLGRKQYFPYEDNLNEISYFDSISRDDGDGIKRKYYWQGTAGKFN